MAPLLAKNTLSSSRPKECPHRQYTTESWRCRRLMHTKEWEPSNVIIFCMSFFSLIRWLTDPDYVYSV